jgi:hypothetical protein
LSVTWLSIWVAVMVVIVWLIKLVSDMALHMRGCRGRDRMVDKACQWHGSPLWRAMSLTSFINHTITTTSASHMESHVTDKLYQPYDHDHDSLSYGEPCHWQALSTIRSRPRQSLIWRAMSLTSFINHTITTNNPQIKITLYRLPNADVTSNVLGGKIL